MGIINCLDDHRFQVKPLDIVIYPDPILAKPTQEVEVFDSRLGELLDQMALTMYQANGIGLAAPQVNISKRITVVDVSEDKSDRIELVNPQIISSQGSVSSEEGCLSIPGYRDTISRHEQVVVRASDRNGKDFEINANGLLAICLQHEIDHLDGVLFVDHLSRLKRELFKRWLKKRDGVE